jgi:L-threonylcarbamoyladenylate synthase
MKYRHYAPEAPVTILRGEAQEAALYISRLPEKNIAVLCYDEELPVFKDFACVSYGSSSKPDSLAHNLFSALRRLDAMGVDRIFARCPEGDGLFRAVENRLKKAAGFQITEV